MFNIDYLALCQLEDFDQEGLLDIMLQMGACKPATLWVENTPKNPARLWELCPDPEWKVWFLEALEAYLVDEKEKKVISNWIERIRESFLSNKVFEEHSYSKVSLKEAYALTGKMIDYTSNLLSLTHQARLEFEGYEIPSREKLCEAYSEAVETSPNPFTEFRSYL